MKRLFELQPRLMCAADIVQKYAETDGINMIWDVGTDHAKLPVWLIQNGIIDYAVASDIRPNPLESAKRTAKIFGVSKQITFILCNGLDSEGTDAENGVVIIAGMGGDTIRDILHNAGWTQNEGTRLILQPMTAHGVLREFLYNESYTIKNEYHASEKDKHYLIIDAHGGGFPENYSSADLRTGKKEHKNSPEKSTGLYIERELKRIEIELNGVQKSGNTGHMSILLEIKKEIENNYGIR